MNSAIQISIPVRDYRHIAIAFMKHNLQIAPNLMTEILAEQGSHSLETQEMVYARSNEDIHTSSSLNTHLYIEASKKMASINWNNQRSRNIKKIKKN
jgi:hypothetical protein